MFMANLHQQFITDRFLQLVVEAGVEKALADKQSVAYGVGTVPVVSLEGDRHAA